MAATDARPVPKKNTAYRHYFAIRKNDGTLITTWAGQDSERSLDGVAFADCTNEATEIGTSGVGYIDLTSTEMNTDATVLKVTVTNTDALPYVCTLFPEDTGDINVTVDASNDKTGYSISGTKTTLDDLNDFDPVTDKVILADAAHGGTAATFTAERIVVESTTAGQPAIKLVGNTTGAGLEAIGGATGVGLKATGTQGAQFKTSGGGSGLLLEGDGGGSGLRVINPSSNPAVEISSTSGTGLYVNGGSGTDISGDIAGTVTNVTTVDTVTNQVTADVTAISGDATAANNLEADYDGTGYTKTNSTIGTATTVTNSVTVSDKTGFSLSASGIDAIWDEVTDALGPVTAREVMNLCLAVLGGVSSGGGTATIVFNRADTTTAAVTATVDTDGNRSSVTLNL